MEDAYLLSYFKCDVERKESGGLAIFACIMSGSSKYAKNRYAMKKWSCSRIYSLLSYACRIHNLYKRDGCCGPIEGIVFLSNKIAQVVASGFLVFLRPNHGEHEHLLFGNF